MSSKKIRSLYPLRQSPLYRLEGKAKFEKVLKLKWDSVPGLLDKRHYRVWLNDNGREIQAPTGLLAKVHKRLGDLLGRIELPDYVYSKKGRSYIDNGRFHQGETPLIKTDIHRFFPSISRQMVFRMFVDDFECAIDVAHRLADICCYNKDHLPTGSPLSGRIAFLAKKRMFDEISLVAVGDGCRMTSYVDDVSISGDRASKTMLGKVRSIIRKHGLRTKNRKSKSFAKDAAKTVTGTIIVGNEIRLPNARHKSIHLSRRKLQAEFNTDDRGKLEKSLRGKLLEAKQLTCSSGSR